MTTVDDLLSLVDAFKTGRDRPLSDSRVSALLFNDGKRVRRLREEGSDVGTKTLAKSIQWFSDNWPEGAAWPDHVPRPVPGSILARTEVAA